MSNLYELPSQERRYDEAGLWIAKLDKTLSGEEEKALQRWLAADPENEPLLLEMAKLWDKMDSLGRLSDLFPEPSAQPASSVFPRLVLPIAAAVLLAVLLGLWVAPSLDAPVAATTEGVYETAVGDYSTVRLQDGTEMVLNTNSRVRVKYTRQYRLLTLEFGEVNVRVATDKARPLSVIAGGRILQAVGTEFNVEIGSNQKIELVVTEGKVWVGLHQSKEKGVASTEPAVLSASTAVAVVAGEELILGSPDEAVTEVSPADIKVRLSWRDGNLIFRGESLEDAVGEIGRYTPVEFVFLHDDLKKVRIAGLFKAGDIDGLLAMLRENFNIAYERIGEQKILLSAR